MKERDKCRWCDKDESNDIEHGDHVYMPSSIVRWIESNSVSYLAPEQIDPKRFHLPLDDDAPEEKRKKD